MNPRTINPNTRRAGAGGGGAHEDMVYARISILRDSFRRQMVMSKDSRHGSHTRIGEGGGYFHKVVA